MHCTQPVLSDLCFFSLTDDIDRQKCDLFLVSTENASSSNMTTKESSFTLNQINTKRKVHLPNPRRRRAHLSIYPAFQFFSRRFFPSNHLSNRRRKKCMLINNFINHSWVSFLLSTPARHKSFSHPRTRKPKKKRTRVPKISQTLTLHCHNQSIVCAQINVEI